MSTQDERILERLDAMVATGRVTEEEAARLRACAGTVEFGPALAAIRARHAAVHTEAAVREGRMTQDEADAALDRVRSGEHSGSLRRHIKGGY
jgi:polyhydroxyalkanoate synthesis regulator phasin